MTQNPIPLNYDASASFGITRTRQFAWIILLINGIFGALGGACVSASLSFLAYMAITSAAAGGRFWRTTSPSGTLILVGMAIIVGIVPLACGITSIFCSFKIRKGSRRATLTAIILVGLQFLILAAITLMGLASTLFDPHEILNKLLGAAFYAVAATVEAILLWLLIRTLRELSARPALPGSPTP